MMTGTRRNEERGGKRDEEEVEAWRKEQQRRRSNEESEKVKKVVRIWKIKKWLEDASLPTSVLFKFFNTSYKEILVYGKNLTGPMKSRRLKFKHTMEFRTKEFHRTNLMIHGTWNPFPCWRISLPAGSLGAKFRCISTEATVLKNPVLGGMILRQIQLSYKL